MIVPTEYRASSAIKDPEILGKLEHPAVSGSSQRFVLGDRFHNSTKSHKSPLCLFHDIDLCMQSNTIKTSYQGSGNFRKNMKRLVRQPFKDLDITLLDITNYLMDYYPLNEAIVRQQECKLSVH